VVLATPSFALYGLQARALGARVVEVPLRAASGEFGFALQQLVRAAEAAKLVLLGSPNNPTGTTLSFEDAGFLARSVPCLLGIDEAYRDFCAQDFSPLLSRNPRLGAVSHLLQALAGASLRAGCLLGAPPLRRAAQGAAPLQPERAHLADRAGTSWPARAHRRADPPGDRRARRVARALRELGLTVHPSGANFLLFEQNPAARRRPPCSAVPRGS